MTFLVIVCHSLRLTTDCFSNILCKFKCKQCRLSSRCQPPRWCHPGRSATPSDATVHRTNFSALRLLQQVVVFIAFCFSFILSLFFISMLYIGLSSPSPATVRTLGRPICIGLSCNISVRSIQRRPVHNHTHAGQAA